MSALVEKLARPEMLALPDRVDAGETLGDQIRLDQNETSNAPLVGANGLNRFPPADPAALTARMADIYGVTVEGVLACRDVPDAVDLLIRCFCRSGVDAIAAPAPLNDWLERAALLQGARMAMTPSSISETDLSGLAKAIDDAGNVKLVFLASPSADAGRVIPPEAIVEFSNQIGDALVIVDESYIEFADRQSLTSALGECENLVILRSLSYAYGIAGASCGAMIASPALISLVKKLQPPAPLSSPVIKAALDVLSPVQGPVIAQRVRDIVDERKRVASALKNADAIQRVYDSEANFLLVEACDAEITKLALAKSGVCVCWREDIGPGVMRISIGSPEENDILLSVFGVAGNNKQRRVGAVTRSTKETDIAVRVDLDQTGGTQIDTGIGYFDHMLDQIAKHGGFSLVLTCKGDLEVDAHHTVEDCMITFGEAFRKALGDKRGIERFGFALPMDETSAEVLIDLSGRPFAKFDGEFSAPLLGDYPTEMTAHAFRSLADSLGAAVHVKVTGENDHHKTEACFKAFGRAVRQAIRVTGDDVVSTKGMLA